jgi:hypothetical protein
MDGIGCARGVLFCKKYIFKEVAKYAIIGVCIFGVIFMLRKGFTQNAKCDEKGSGCDGGNIA